APPAVHRLHASVRSVRRLIARHELDARPAAPAGVRGLEPHARWTVTTPIAASIRSLTLALAIAFLVTSVGVSYWTILASDQLANDPFHPRLVAASNDRPRGAIPGRNRAPLAPTEKGPSGFVRSYTGQSLPPVAGYTP